MDENEKPRRIIPRYKEFASAQDARGVRRRPREDSLNNTTSDFFGLIYRIAFYGFNIGGALTFLQVAWQVFELATLKHWPSFSAMEALMVVDLAPKGDGILNTILLHISLGVFMMGLCFIIMTIAQLFMRSGAR